MLQRLPERPFRTLPGGILRKFLRRLSQFPLSFLAQSRWAPVPPANCAHGYATPAKEVRNKKRKGPGRIQAWPLNASPCSVSCYMPVHRNTLAGSSKRSFTSYVVCLVHLVCLVHRVGLVQPNKRDKRDKPNNGLLIPPGPERRTRGRERVPYRLDRFLSFRIFHRGPDRQV